MSVNRRSAIKQLLYVSAGMALLPACLQHTTRASLALKNIKVDGQQEKMLAELVEAIIPATTTPGAKALSAHLFTLIMIDDCYTKEDQQKWLSGLQQFNKLCIAKNGYAFEKCTPVQSAAFLEERETKKTDNSDISFFYNTTKHLTIQAYISSKYFLTNVQIYELVPARFKGCVPLKPITRKIA
ncbi:gluconate 2-dehydrogenase subunit 3-like protein [Chitinophaga niastensis]|uniref:Gluconate 2-dehydrogenase subunit 3-like protein n=1 Tax=Chitinophaga niastensis TaxID=536980 RepID=A0A2P8HDB8_CHINA|nr:gluconate 2-dehydrogenase subunit 3 family protein [Chitinophaga niastensis]PSL44208.1 gluconate 2-dehydrogenase subunit 3-like protein [Chitinophaga niastensis]